MNPILNRLNSQKSNGLDQIKNQIANDPKGTFSQMMNNPQFSEFVKKNRGKSPEQIAREYGLDWSRVKNLL